MGIGCQNKFAIFTEGQSLNADTFLCLKDCSFRIALVKLASISANGDFPAVRRPSNGCEWIFGRMSNFALYDSGIDVPNENLQFDEKNVKMWWCWKTRTKTDFRLKKRIVCGIFVAFEANVFGLFLLLEAAHPYLDHTFQGRQWTIINYHRRLKIASPSSLQKGTNLE